jgi:hypothetical protein
LAFRFHFVKLRIAAPTKLLDEITHLLQQLLLTIRFQLPHPTLIIKLPQLFVTTAAVQTIQIIRLIHLCHHRLAFLVSGAIQTRNGIAGSS